MPLLGYGTFSWTAKKNEMEVAVKEALISGYRHFDCATLYGNEKEVGKALQFGMEELGIARKDLFVTGKLWSTQHNAADKAVKQSLQDLGLQYLDLYLIHWPMAYQQGSQLFPINGTDGSMKLDTSIHYFETWRKMETIYKSGLVKNVGVANFNSTQVQYILDHGNVKPVVNQVECHPFFNQNKLKQYLDSVNMTMVAYSPLGNPARPFRKSDPRVLDNKKLIKMGKKYAKTAAQVVLKWQVQRGVAAIPNSMSKGRIRQNFDIMDFELSAGDMDEIDNMAKKPLRFNNRVNLYGKHPHYPFRDEL